MPISDAVGDLHDGTHPDGLANGDNGSDLKSLPAEVGGAAGDMINTDISRAGKHHYAAFYITQATCFSFFTCLETLNQGNWNVSVSSHSLTWAAAPPY